MQRSIWGVVKSLMITLFQIYCWVFCEKNAENWSQFDEVMNPFLDHPTVNALVLVRMY